MENRIKRNHEMCDPRRNKLRYVVILPPQSTDVDMMTSFDHTGNSGATGTLPQQNCDNHDKDATDAHPEVLLMEAPLHHGK